MLSQKRAEIAQSEERLRMERIFFDGAMEQLRYFKRTFTDGANSFQFMQLPQIEESAKLAVDRALGKVPDYSVPVPAPDEPITSIPFSGEPSKLTPPPDMDMPAIAPEKLNGGPEHVSGHASPGKSKAHQRGKERRPEA